MMTTTTGYDGLLIPDPLKLSPYHNVSDIKVSPKSVVLQQQQRESMPAITHTSVQLPATKPTTMALPIGPTLGKNM